MELITLERRYKTMDNVSIIQKSLLNQLERIESLDMNNEGSKAEIQRATAIGKMSSEFLKACNVKLAIEKASNNSKAKRTELCKFVGIITND